MSDRILGAFGLLLSVGMIYAATQLPVPFISDPVGSKTFPIIVAVIMGMSSLYFLLRPDPDPQWPGLDRLVEIAAAVVVLIAYSLLLPEFGFLIATVFATAYLSWRLGSSLIGAAIAGVLTSVGLYVVFRLILGLSLATGPMGF
ncbi:MAG: tripartite tricarboxylate transporter TctB family protein [Pseudomonadota bacterium]